MRPGAGYRVRSAAALGAGLAVAALAAAGGCAGPVGSGPSARATEVAPPHADFGGLDLWGYAIPDTPRATARLMARYADRPVPLSPDLAARWKASGLRAVSVPAPEVAGMMAEARSAVRDEASAVGAAQRLWLGEAPGWLEIARGRETTRGTFVEIDGGTIELGPGRVRLLARCWVVPADEPPGAGAPPRAALRLELVPQHREAGSPLRKLEREVGITASPTPLEEGLVFRRLSAEVTLTGADALVIAPDEPGADWGAPVSRDETPPPPPEGGAAAASEPDSAELVPTLGRVLFCTPGAGPGRPGKRIVLVLVARVPPKFSLFAD